MGGVRREAIERMFLDGWRPYAWIAGAAILLYAVTLAFGFTHLDDSEFIQENYAFISDLGNIPQAFGQTIFANICIPYYRPLLALSFMIDAQIGAMTPAVYHGTNVLLHAAVSCLVYLLLRELSARRETAFIYAGLFAVHPVVTQAVAWVPGRNDLLLALWVIPAFVFFVRYFRTGSFRAYVSSLILFGLALFTKESAVILLALVALFAALWWRSCAVKRGIVTAFAGWAALACVWAIMRSAALLFACDKSTVAGMASAVWISLPAVVQYVGKIFFPFNLSVYPTIADTGWLWGALALAALAAIAFSSGSRDWRLAFFGFVWFACFLVSSFARPSADCVLDFQEHRLYVPLVGCIIMLMGLGFLKAADLSRRAVLFSCLGVAAVFAALTLSHEMDFRGREAFWSNASRTAPRSAFVHLRTGFVYYRNGEIDKAEEEYRTALELDPLLAAAHTKMGLLLMDRHEYEAAAREFMKEIALSPKFSAAYLCLGVARYRQGRDDEAVVLWRKALALDPFNVDAAKNLAIYYAREGDKPRAACFLKRLQGMGVQVPRQALEEAGLGTE